MAKDPLGTSSQNSMVQGVRPKALGRVTNRQLADFVCHCIQQRDSRPRSRQLLKHHYFDSIRAEKLTLKLGAEALRLPMPKDSDTHTHAELHEYTTGGGSTSGSISRASSIAGKPCAPGFSCSSRDALYPTNVEPTPLPSLPTKVFKPAPYACCRQVVASLNRWAYPSDSKRLRNQGMNPLAPL